MPSSLADRFFVYILKCSDGTFYVGHSQDVENRLETHNAGRGALWTAVRRPVELVYTEIADSELTAIRRERQVKRWTHAKKSALIRGDFGRLKSLAKRRNP